MARFSLEEVPPTRGRMPAHPKNRDKDPEAYDAYKEWEREQQLRREKQEEQNRIYAEEKAKRNAEAAEELNRRKDTVMSALSATANSVPFTGSEVAEAAEEQRQKKLDKWYDYKKGIRSLATAGELVFSGGTLLGAYANYKRWADLANLVNPTRVQLAKATIANLLQEAQVPMQVGSALIDSYQTYDAATRGDSFDKYYNAGSTGLSALGYVGAQDFFRGTYPKVDRFLDAMGILQAAGDYVKFGYDAIKGDKNE